MIDKSIKNYLLKLERKLTILGFVTAVVSPKIGRSGFNSLLNGGVVHRKMDMVSLSVRY